MKIAIPLGGPRFAEEVLVPAAHLATIAGAEVHLLRVLDQSAVNSQWVGWLARDYSLAGTPMWVSHGSLGEEMLPDWGAPALAKDRYVERVEHVAEKHLDQIASRFFPQGAERSVVLGENIASGIEDYSRERGIDLIAMATHGRSGMTGKITRIDNPIDVMHLIHKALRAQASHVEKMANQLELGGSLQNIKGAFNLWASALAYHAEIEDAFMAAALLDWQPARDNELQHRDLELKLEAVQSYLYDEIGRTQVIACTQRHLFGHVVTVRIAQDDHLEEEEEFVLPEIR